MRNVDVPKRIEGGAENLVRRVRRTREKPFSEQIKELRASLGLTQEAFCDRYHIPLANLRNWEQAAKGVIPDTAARLLIEMIKVDPERVAQIVEKARRRATVKNLETA